MSKGSKRRPQQVDQKTLEENWSRAFGGTGSRVDDPRVLPVDEQLPKGKRGEI